MQGEEGHVFNIGLDDENGGYVMTKYLLERGYRHIKICAGRDSGVDHLRYVGVQKAMDEFAKDGQRLQFVALGMNVEKRRENYLWMLNRRMPGTALFFLSDLYALEAISLYSDYGISIPEDIGIAGFDNISYASISVPKLTTIRQDIKEKAEKAMDILIHEIQEGKVQGASEKTLEIYLPIRLMVRKSV